MELQVLRLLPWHSGCAIPEGIDAAISAAIARSAHWRLSKPAGSTTSILQAEALATAWSEGLLFAHAYRDGTLLFSLWENALAFEAAEEIDPIEYTRHKRKSGKELLNGVHLSSHAILELTTLITDELHRGGHSVSYPAGEGSSYVFSSAFLALESAELSRHHRCKGLIEEILVPSEVAKLVERGEDGAFDYTGQAGFADEAPRQIADICHCVRITGFSEVHCSWASVVTVGISSERVRQLVWRLQRGIQHAWCLAHTMERLITQCIGKTAPAATVQEIERIMQLCTTLTLGVERFRGVPAGMSTEGEIKLYNALRASSRLEDMYEKVARLRTVLNELYLTKTERRRRRFETGLGVLAYFIAVISGWIAWGEIRGGDQLPAHEIGIVVAILALGTTLYLVKGARA